MANQYPPNFDQMVAKYGLKKHLKILKEFILPSVGYALDPSAPIDLTGSRLGGIPALPPGFVWPKFRGRKLDPLMQINLEDLPRHGLASQLPHKGVLSFFYDLKETPWGFDPKELDAFRVYHFPDPSVLIPGSKKTQKIWLKHAALKFWKCWTLPGISDQHGDRMYKRMGAKNEDQKWDLDAKVTELCVRMHRLSKHMVNGPFHRIGGYSDNVQNDMQTEAELVTNGLYCGDEPDFRDPRAKALIKSSTQWKLLLQMDSDDDLDIIWGDAGRLYFWVRESDLAKADFSHVWLGLQCL